MGIYHYKVRDSEGREHRYSTGLESISDARKFVNQLFKDGKLLRQQVSRPTIETYSKDFWKFDGPRVRSALLRKRLTPAYCNAMDGTLRLHWFPVFGGKPIDKLSVRDIESLVNEKAHGDPKNGKRPLSPKMVNQVINAMKAVYQEAVRLGDLEQSPFDRVKPLQKKTKPRNMLTPEEASVLLSDPSNFQNQTLWALNLTAATTGARAGELLGLKVKHLYEDRIDIAGVIRAEIGYVEDTKTGEAGFRSIPIPPVTSKALSELANGKTGEDFIFGTLAPYMTAQSINDALENAGIMSKAERIRRSIDFHSWRHWYNSMLRGNIVDPRGWTGT